MRRARRKGPIGSDDSQVQDRPSPGKPLCILTSNVTLHINLLQQAGQFYTKNVGFAPRVTRVQANLVAVLGRATHEFPVEEHVADDGVDVPAVIKALELDVDEC